MPIEFKLPDLGENISSAGVLAVLVKAGDTIQADTPVLEIETDKATIEVPSTVGGKVSKVLVKPGEKATVGQVILQLEEEAGAPKAEAPKKPPAAEKPPEPAAAAPAPAPVAQPGASKPAGGGTSVQEVKLPDLGENITSVNILAVLVKAGDTVGPDTGIVEIETDKATVEVPAGVSGVVEKVHVKSGDKAAPGQHLLTVKGDAPLAPSAPAGGERKATAPAPVPPSAPPRPVSNGAPRSSAAPVASSPGKAAPASPSVRRLAREIGVDVNQVRGSGPRGRISHEDIKAHARALLRQPAHRQGGAAAGPWRPTHVPLPDFTKFGQVEREAMTGIRRKTAENMGQAWSTIPMVTQFDKADVTDLEKLRQKLDPKARQQGGKLTVTAILMKVCASALKRFPKFNASIDLAKEEIVLKKYFNIGVAVDTERGLLVPVLKDVPSKNIFEISAELQTIAEKARNRKITPDDLQGSCFTITNLGGIGGTSFTPIVNPPEVAILGVSRSSVEPVWQDGQWVPRTLLPLSMSYDHRLIDGAEAARFLRFVCEALENPALLLFEG